MTVLYDAGLLIAADRGNREVWADHRPRLELGVVPVTAAPVVSQVSRSSRQVQLRRLLRGCEIVAFSPEEVHEVGELLGRAGSSDVVDAHAVLTASRRGSSVITSDEDDLGRLSNCLQQPVAIHQVGTRRRPRQR
ncbi:MAG: PIN domain-containing protein [Actinomycetota bacterium]|nr:PIN domain-containing protein [Actinomycetota bacterium]